MRACSTDGKVIETLYKWDNHGIRISLLGQMIVDEKGTIRIVYYTLEPDRENPQIPVLVCLQPVTEKREMLEIDFAVPAYNKESYEQAVVDFYRDYPNCKINLVTYEEESRLLTELVAGDGPVLVDTALVSFTENKELWECLDERLSDSSLDGVFLDKLLEAGQIDGSQYGLSPDWYLMTYAGIMEDIFSPENLRSLEAMCSSELNYIGYPGADGSRHYIMAGSPITIRAGAEEWEKQAAMAFLEVLFSYDTQRQIQDMDMSTREDVLMAQIDNMNTSVSNMVNGENISMEIDAEKTREHILQLCEKGTIYPLEGSVLKDMILEELSSCFDGTKTAEEAAATLQNRAQLYLDENKMKE